ncbi:hypothetical protein [Brucella inopinata]|uniref:hypothetical protein n=1 Tax=Brucella inopinata TaxID=1218315 RepID=UPI0008711857|nr:hypothetical protein [Brucella inopinata]SCD25525.1 hypothetical protein BR141012304_21066 [Brucella inopinata]
MKSTTDFTVLGMFVDRKRILFRMSIQQVARACSVPSDDVHRVIAGKAIGPDSLASFCAWLGRSPSFFDSNELATRREVYP